MGSYNKMRYVNNDKIQEFAIVEVMGDFFFYSLRARFDGERKFREIIRSYDSETCEAVMNKIKDGKCF